MSCEIDKIKAGDVYSRHSHGVVDEVINTWNGPVVKVTNEKGDKWGVGGDIFAKEFCLAGQVSSEQEVNRTTAIEVLREHVSTAMTVCYRTKPEPKDVAAKLAGGRCETQSDRAWNKVVKDAIAGEERVMVGRHSNSFDEHGRLRFTEKGAGLRLVDPRTIEWLIVNQVKYVVS